MNFAAIRTRRKLIALTITAAIFASGTVKASPLPDADWLSYNGTANGQRYSPLDQITVRNVATLTEICRLKIDDSRTFQAGLVQLGGTLFFTNAHDTLAIDAASGKTIWQQPIGDPFQGEFFSSVPAIWQGLLSVGTAGGDWGIRGRIIAYEQESGREVWRFYTIPRGKDAGAETWTDRKSALRWWR